MTIEHINEFDTLNAGREKINKHAIDSANRAELNSIDAKSVANQANQTSQSAEAIAINTDDRLDNIIAGEMQDAEVIDARRPFGSEAYATLGDRLDANDKTVETITTELDKKSKLSNDKVDLINDKNATSGTTNVANFAGQELGKNAPIGQIIHHYTDGTLYQVDNVGEGVFYIFRQANNPSRRPDKPANYVGTGNFFQFQRAKDDGTGAMKSTEYLLDLTNDADFLWRKQRPIIFTSTKTDDNTPAFMFQPQFEHKRVWQVNYKINTPLFEMQYNNNRAHIIVGNTVDGLNLQTIKGDIVLQPESKKVYVNGSIYGYEGGNYGRAMLAAYGAKSQRPTSDLYIGKFFFDTFLGKPVWYNGTDWVDATGTVV